MISILKKAKKLSPAMQKQYNDYKDSAPIAFELIFTNTPERPMTAHDFGFAPKTLDNV